MYQLLIVARIGKVSIKSLHKRGMNYKVEWPFHTLITQRKVWQTRQQMA